MYNWCFVCFRVHIDVECGILALIYRQGPPSITVHVLILAATIFSLTYMENVDSSAVFCFYLFNLNYSTLYLLLLGFSCYIYLGELIIL